MIIGLRLEHHGDALKVRFGISVNARLLFTDTCVAANPAPAAAAPMPIPQPDNPVLIACKGDIKRSCSNLPAGNGRIKQCMKSHLPEPPEQCKETLIQARRRD